MNMIHNSIIYPEDWPDIMMSMMVMVKSVSLIQARYRDMRQQKGLKIKSMWLNLGHHKINFVPSGGKLPVDGAEGLLQYGRVGEEGVIVL